MKGAAWDLRHKQQPFTKHAQLTAKQDFFFSLLLPLFHISCQSQSNPFSCRASSGLWSPNPSSSASSEKPLVSHSPAKSTGHVSEVFPSEQGSEQTSLSEKSLNILSSGGAEQHRKTMCLGLKRGKKISYFNFFFKKANVKIAKFLLMSKFKYMPFVLRQAGLPQTAQPW